MIILSTLLSACKTATPTPAPAPAPAPVATVPTEVVCSEVSVDACADTPSCVLVLGREVNVDDEPCLAPETPNTPQGCIDADPICTDIETVASNGAGELYVFGGCIPEGWTVQALDVGECTSCAEVPVDECAARGCQVIEGRQLLAPTVMSGNECVDPSAPSEPLACTEALDCDTAITYATDGLDGSVYVFSSGCIPAGWTEVGGPFPDCGCEDYAPGACPAGCSVIEGIPLSTDMGTACLDFTDPLEPLACQTDMGCGDLETYAVDPDSSETYWFSSTCTPPGWALDAEQSYPSCP